MPRSEGGSRNPGPAEKRDPAPVFTGVPRRDGGVRGNFNSFHQEKDSEPGEDKRPTPIGICASAPLEVHEEVFLFFSMNFRVLFLPRA